MKTECERSRRRCRASCFVDHFVRNAPTVAARPICNNCVAERDFAGDLEQIEGNYP